MTLTQAYIRNTGNPYQLPREQHKWAIPTRLNTDAGKDVGLNRSSDEVSVMEIERRV